MNCQLLRLSIYPHILYFCSEKFTCAHVANVNYDLSSKLRTVHSALRLIQPIFSFSILDDALCGNYYHQNFTKSKDDSDDVRVELLKLRPLQRRKIRHETCCYYLCSPRAGCSIHYRHSTSDGITLSGCPSQRSTHLTNFDDSSI